MKREIIIFVIAGGVNVLWLVGNIPNLTFIWIAPGVNWHSLQRRVKEVDPRGCTPPSLPLWGGILN